MDSVSRRRKDENGYLHVAQSHISKECVNPYYGHEIPDWQAQGLSADEIYYGYRSAKELSMAAMSFNGLPLLLGHHPESADHPQKEHRIGSLGTDAEFKDSYLDNSLIITDSTAIALIESGQLVDLSAAYRYEPLFLPGYFKGQAYDFIMTKIRGNHVALVEEGRAGPDVVVADENSFKQRKISMADEEKNLSILWMLKELGTLQKRLKDLDPLQADEESQQLLKEVGENPAESLGQESLSQEKDEKAEDTYLYALLRALAEKDQALNTKSASTNQQPADEQAKYPEQQLNKSLANDFSSLLGAFTDFLNRVQKTYASSLANGFAEESSFISGLSLGEKSLGAENLGAKDFAEKSLVEKILDEKILAEESLEKGLGEIFKLNLLATEPVLDSEALPESIPLEIVKKLLELQKTRCEEELEKHYQSLNTAAREVSPLLGLINDPLSFDSAGQIYKSALVHAGIDPKTQPVSSWRGMVQVLSHERQNLSLPILAQDMDIAHDFTGPFAGLKNINLS